MKKLFLILPRLAAISLMCAVLFSLSTGVRAASGYVYERDVTSKSLCTSYESYSSSKKACYFTCTSKSACAKVEEKVYGALEERQEEEHDKRDEKMLAQYIVSNGEMITLIEGAPQSAYIDIWNKVALLSPDAVSNAYIESFAIFANDKDETIAFVDDADGDRKWRIGFNLPLYNEESLEDKTSAIVHELAHIISINESQFTITKRCTTMKFENSCMAKDSYMNEFWEAYWKKEPDPRYNSSHFVSKYAASSRYEDFAESFASFVLSDSKPASGRTKYKKIASFYNYDELVLMRQQMRSALLMP